MTVLLAFLRWFAIAFTIAISGALLAGYAVEFKPECFSLLPTRCAR